MNKERKLIWCEDFDYEGKPCEDYWSYDLGPWRPNGELEYYTDRLENVYVKDSLLHIVARKEHFGEREYTSGRIKTQHKFFYQYGYAEIKAKVPEGRGCWPAIWMMAEKEKYGHWPKSGEIDIMEYVGGNDRIQSVLHTAGYNHRNNKDRKQFSGRFDPNVFHLFGFEWDKDYMAFYLDEALYYEIRFDREHETEELWAAWPFDEEFYFILNLAVGGFLGSMNGIDEEAFPQEFIVDYIKVYQ